MNAWVNSFGGNPVKPANPQYEPLDLTANITLVWPLEAMEGEPYVAALIDVISASSSGLAITMPPATGGAPGITAIFQNTSAETFLVKDNDGTQIASIAAGEQWVQVLTDNTTNAGTWQFIQLGALTSDAQAAALAGNGLQAILTRLQTTITVRETAANGAIVVNDRATLVSWTGAVGTLTLDALATLTPKWWCIVTNRGSDELTIATTGNTINGAATLVLPASGTALGYSAVIVAGATQFTAALGVPTPTPITAGGTGATNAGDALVNLGGSAIGISIFAAPSAAAILAILGITQSLLTEKTIAISQGVSSGDSGTMYVATASVTLALPQTGTLDTNFFIGGYAQGGNITLDPDAADAINGGVAGTNLVVLEGSSFLLTTDGAGNWWPFFFSQATPGNWAVAGGTADVITATYDPINTALTDGMLLGFRALLQNLTTTPTFAPDSLAAHTITRRGGLALLAGDIPGALAECLVRYNLANTRWELLNPATIQMPWANAGGTVDAITATYSPSVGALFDGLTVGVRAAGANATTTPTFAPNLLAPHVITKRGGSPLAAGDIPAANSEIILRYRLASTTWELLNPQSTPAGSALGGGFGALMVKNNAGTPNTKTDVTVGAITVTDGSASVNLSSVSVTIDATINGANGLDSGGLANTTWYTVWIIYNSATATTAGLISTSASAPTMPAGYTFKARVGYVRTDGAAHFLRVLQYGRDAQYYSPPVPQIATGAAVGDPTIPTWVAASVSTFVPPTASKIRLYVTLEGTNSVVIVAPNPNYLDDVDLVNPPPLTLFGDTGIQWSIGADFVLESTNIYWASSAGSASVWCLGWTDNL